MLWKILKRVNDILDNWLYGGNDDTEMTKFLKERGDDMAKEIADNIKERYIIKEKKK